MTRSSKIEHNSVARAALKKDFKLEKNLAPTDTRRSIYSRYSEIIVTAIVISYVIATHGDFRNVTETWLPGIRLQSGLPSEQEPTLGDGVRTLASKLRQSVTAF